MVDDSRTIRQLVRLALSKDPTITVVGEAADAYEARAAIKALNPDVITLDVEMPRMSGTEFLQKIMDLRPMPVVMLSHLTKRGSDVAVEALAAAAVDCLGKPSAAHEMTDGIFADSLCRSIHTAAGARISGRQAPARPATQGFRWNGHLVMLGASTGGVDAIERVLSRYPQNGPPTLITQHMPQNFLSSFADRLNAMLPLTVALARHGTNPAQGHVYIAPGGSTHLTLEGPPNRPRIALKEGPPRSGHRPSVDVLFESCVSYSATCVGVILTGMGKDGAEGLLALRKAGARTLGQDDASSVVYGMPKAAHILGAVEEQVELDEMATAILARTSCSGAGDPRVH